MATNIAFDIIAHDRASRTFNNVGDAASRSTGRLKSFAKAGALAAGAAAVVAGKALWEMGQAAASDEAAQKKLALQLKNSAGATDKHVASVEDWIERSGRLLGVTDDELRPALARLVTATKDVGKAQDLAALAMDVSAGTGKSLQSVTEALMKAQNGSMSGLSRLGIATKDAEGKTKSFDAVIGEMAATFNGQAVEAAETTEGRFKRLSVQFDETKEAIGARLLPIAGKLADWLLRVGIPAFEKLATWVGDKVGPIMVRLGEWIREKLVPALKDLAADIMSGVRRAMEVLSGSGFEVKNVMQFIGDTITKVVIPAVGWLAKNVLPVLAGQFRISVTIISKLIDLAKGAYRAFKTGFAPILAIINPIIDRLQTLIDKMREAKGEELIGRGVIQGSGPIGGVDEGDGRGQVGTGAGTTAPPNSHTRSTTRSPRVASGRVADSAGLDYRALVSALTEALMAAQVVRLENAGQGAYVGGAVF